MLALRHPKGCLNGLWVIMDVMLTCCCCWVDDVVDLWPGILVVLWNCRHVIIKRESWNWQEVVNVIATSKVVHVENFWRSVRGVGHLHKFILEKTLDPRRVDILKAICGIPVIACFELENQTIWHIYCRF